MLKGTSQFTTTRANKDLVPITAHLQNGSVISGDLFVMKQGQRLQDLLNDGNRKFLPLRMSGGGMLFINRDRLEFISERLEETEPSESAAS